MRMDYTAPMHEKNDKLKEPLPKKLSDVPGYLKRTIGGTLYRVFYIFKLVFEVKPFLFAIMLLITIYNGIMPLVGTLISARLLESVVNSFNEEVNLIIPLMYQFGYTFINTLVSSISNMSIQLTGEVVANHVKCKIMNKAKDLDVALFDMPDFYERLENANREAGTRPVNVLRSSFELVSKVISMISYIGALTVILRSMPSFSIVFFVLYLCLTMAKAIVSFHFRHKNFRYMFRRSKERRKMDYYSNLLVNKDIVKEVRLYNLSNFFIEKYKNVFHNYFGGIKKLIIQEGIFNLVLSFAEAVMNGILFYLIATNVRKIADYTIYTSALQAISSSLKSIISLTSSIYEGSLFIDNMILFMNEKQTISPISAVPLKPERHIGHTIELRDVSFRYPGTDRDVIHNLNLTINAGETVALVGLNGAGKTTFIKLITRLYDPTSGVILLDGKDIREYDIEALYRLYGIIFQDFARYAESAGDNIAFGNVALKKCNERIVHSAKKSGADRFIDNMPLGYDTPLTRYFEHDGIELSVGQWQKLSIARAFYGDADIFILDEPTASLDAIAEHEIYSQFDRLRMGKTSIFVSHRLSSATIADVIVVLNNGQIIEKGSHEELMKLCGKYYELFSTQAERYQKN